jgi:protoporphyrin/coproporphyrin ferrochelatase
MKTEGATAVLLTAVGGPDSLEDVGPFLSDIRGGRPTPQALIDEFRERYRRIGGKSPLLEITRSQAKALEDRLNDGEGAFRTYVGMRNWHPYIRETMAEIARDGPSRLVVLPLTPYYSRRSVGMYFAAVKDALPELGRDIETTYVERWNTEPALVDAFAKMVGAGLRSLRALGFADPPVVFTAHSLPRKLIDEGDPYERELRATMELVLRRLPRLRASMAYQSAGRTEEPWLGPSLEETLETHAKAGELAVLVVPFGFVSDHLEILYDVDIEANDTASRLGMVLERTQSMNTDTRFIDAMASAVRNAARRVGAGFPT